MTGSPGTDVARWAEALARGGRAGLARAITAVENDAAEGRAVLRAAHGLAGRALTVGVTGAPGVGKSTLVAAYVGELRRRGLTVGVLAVDPSSPFTGGALLGDRIRMLDHAGDDGVFVRSLASRGHLGGLAPSACAVVDAMDAAGRDVIAVETVGVGQSEIEIAGLADVRVVVWAPGAGDGVQAAKAGVLEIADAIVVNKADLPQAAATEAALRGASSRGAGPAPAVLRVSATRGEGVAALADVIAERGRSAGDGAARRLRFQIAARAASRAGAAAGRHARLPGLAADVRRGRLSLDDAAAALLAEIAGGG